MDGPLLASHIDLLRKIRKKNPATVFLRIVSYFDRFGRKNKKKSSTEMDPTIVYNFYDVYVWVRCGVYRYDRKYRENEREIERDRKRDASFDICKSNLFISKEFPRLIGTCFSFVVCVCVFVSFFLFQLMFV